MHRALLMAYQIMLDRVLLEDRIIERQHRAAGIAEHHVDTLIDQRLDNDFRARQ